MYVIGTAGHVDHGKSLLVEALTGIDPDRLHEEKARGMTIDLGFAWLTLPGGRSVSIVDVPGHERFIKNMLAGAGGVDLALLVVAADDGVMPQTREHLAILDLLGVERGVVAISKRDLVDDDWLALVESDVREVLADTTLRDAPIVACSAVTRAGLDDLLGEIERAINDLPPKRSVGRPRLPIDRVFTIGGFGTVVTGTLIDGELGAGQEVAVAPDGLRARVRGLQSHGETVERALPGTRTAVNLSGIPREELRRGQVLTDPGALRATDVVDVRLHAVTGIRHAIRHNMQVTFHCFSDEANASVRLLEGDELRAGDEAWAQIKLERPVAVVRGDRFVIRTPNDTVGGGIIADTRPRRHRRRDSALFDALERMLASSPIDRVRDAVARAPMTPASALAPMLALAPKDIEDALRTLEQQGDIVLAGEGDERRVASREYVAQTAERVRRTLDEYHRQHPLRPGMPAEELRSRLRLDQRQFAALAPLLDGVRVAGATVSLEGFTRTPSSEQQRAMDTYLAALRATPGASSDGLDAEALAYLADTGRVVEGGDVVFEAESFASMTERVREQIARDGSITLAQTRDLLGSNRRVAQALLEELDRAKVTRRVGDARVLRS